MSPTAVSYYVNGLRMPGALEIHKLAGALGVTIGWLLGEDGGESQLGSGVKGVVPEMNNWQRRALDAEAKLAALQHVLGRGPEKSTVSEERGGQRMVIAEGPKARTDRADRTDLGAEVNPFLADDVAAAGLPPGGGGGAADLRRQRVSTAETIQGVSPEVAEIAREAALIAARMVREESAVGVARESSRAGRGRAALPTGSRVGPVGGAGVGSGSQPGAVARARTGYAEVSPAKTPGRGRTKAG
jgi:transcriptional regulator with XRE-family HTH domain